MAAPRSISSLALADIEAMQAAHKRHVAALLASIHGLAGDMCGRLGSMTSDGAAPTRDELLVVVEDLKELAALAQQLQRAVPAEQLALDFG